VDSETLSESEQVWTIWSLMVFVCTTFRFFCLMIHTYIAHGDWWAHEPRVEARVAPQRVTLDKVAKSWQIDPGCRKLSFGGRFDGMGKPPVFWPSSVKLTSIFPLAHRFVICQYIRANSGKLRANSRRLAIRGPRKPPIEVGNVKSRFLEKFIHFSSSFIHVSWVSFPPGEPLG
jgi:hypothetical protein